MISQTSIAIAILANLKKGHPPRTPGKEDKEDKDGSRYASPDQRRAYDEGCARYGDICHRCNQRGHWQSECPMRWQNNNMVCNQCGSTQHSQHNCPEVARELTQKRQKTMIERNTMITTEWRKRGKKKKKNLQIIKVVEKMAMRSKERRRKTRSKRRKQR